MKEFIEEIVYSTSFLFELMKNGSFEDCENFTKAENDLYSILNIDAYNYLSIVASTNEEAYRTTELENFEIAMDNQKTHMLIRRIDNMTKKYYNRSQSIMLPYQEIKLDNNKYIRMRNLEGSLNELWDKILTSVEVKFLYLLTIDEKISDKRKGTIFSNMMFVHPTLQDRIFKKQINIGSYVKEEDNIYNGLWENIKEIYENELSNYCYNFSKELIKTMIFEDITDEEILIYEIYLRSLFNYLDDDVLENLNYEYHNEEEFKIENEFGDKCVREAFRKINEDTNTINKIKTL